MSAWVMFGEALAQGIAQLLEAQKNKTAAAVGTDIALIDSVTVAILQKNAEIKGLAIDWTDPAAVVNYLHTLPTFVPIPDPETAQTTAGPAPGPVLVPQPAPEPAPLVMPADVNEQPPPAAPSGPLPVEPGE